MFGVAASLVWAPAGARPVALNGSDVVPRPAVVILWASWCVSCREELKRMPELISAARPLPVALLAIDTPPAARAALRGLPVGGARLFADARPPARVLADWGATMLPLAVALDRHGRVCGRKHGLLGTDQLRDWAKRCS